MNIKKTFFIIAAFISVLQNDFIHSEIQDVTITWTAQECFSSCTKGMYGQFRKIQGVSEISINQGAGEAVLHWQPNASFAYQPVQVAMQLLGLSINTIKVRVRGTLINDSQNSYTLLSIGDGTSFTLISIPSPATNQYVEQYNIQNRTLSADMIQQLQKAQQDQQIATVTGPLFMPWRSPPNYLVVQNIQFSKN